MGYTRGMTSTIARDQVAADHRAYLAGLTLDQLQGRMRVSFAAGEAWDYAAFTAELHRRAA